MTEKQIQEQIRHARKIVASWPLWKRNILIQSGKPTVDKPRKPVVNDRDDY